MTIAQELKQTYDINYIKDMLLKSASIPFKTKIRKRSPRSRI